MALRFATEIEQVPYAPEERIRDNVDAMVEYIGRELRQDLGDGDLRLFATRVLEHTRLLLTRFNNNLSEEIDLLAWIGRNLFELLLLSRFALSTPENLQRIILLEIVDYQELDRAWFDGEAAEPTDEDAVAFKKSVENLQAWIDKEGLNPGKRPNLKELAEETDSLEFYFPVFRTLSKYVHPTPVFLFGNRNFVHGDKARAGVIVTAQYCAALLLYEMPSDIERMKRAR
jgi:hypothetical protein